MTVDVRCGHNLPHRSKLIRLWICIGWILGPEIATTMWIWVFNLYCKHFWIRSRTLFQSRYFQPFWNKIRILLSIRTSKIDGGKLIVSENRLSIVICLNQKILPIIIICYYKILSVILRIGWSCYHGNHKFYYKCWQWTI